MLLFFKEIFFQLNYHYTNKIHISTLQGLVRFVLCQMPFSGFQ